jgi:hypothetical protein
MPSSLFRAPEGPLLSGCCERDPAIWGEVDCPLFGGRIVLFTDERPGEGPERGP